MWLDKPPAGRYVRSMVVTHSSWFFYFTNAGAAQSPSGVGSVL